MNQEPQAAPVICTKCGADKVAKSHPRSRDRLAMRFLPKRPYRCLYCYHRFWRSEPFFASQSRVISWLGVVALIIGFAVLPNWSDSTRERQESFIELSSGPAVLQNDAPAQLLEPNIEPSKTAQSIYLEARPLIKLESLNDAADDAEPEFRTESAGSQVAQTTPAESNDAIESVAGEGLDGQNLADNISNPAAVLEQLYTTEQLQQRLSLAKRSAEQAERVNLQQRARLQQSMANDPDELQSLLKVDINFRIDQWRKAWEVGLVDDYLGFYSERFEPASELSREQWVEQRKQRIRPSKKVDLALDNFDVVFSDDNTISTVSFDQVYQSGSYTESSRKQLVLHKQQEQWKIVSEIEISQDSN